MSVHDIQHVIWHVPCDTTISQLTRLISGSVDNEHCNWSESELYRNTIELQLKKAGCFRFGNRLPWWLKNAL